jgi:D-glycero-alpha-D-manno-heptose-7-phosphate kinase
VDKLNYIISQSATIRESLVKIDLNSIGMVFIHDESERIVGVATDGDIRSSLLDQVTLSDSIERAFNPNFVWRRDTDSRESILKLLDSAIKAIPILDVDSRLVDVVTSSQFPLLIEQDVFVRSKAPVRISFAGGGSDLTHYFMVEEGGAVINATISLYCHVTLRPRADLKITIDSLDLAESVNYEDLDDLFGRSDNFDLFRSLLKLIKPDFGFDLSVNSDFPSGSGLGGSSSVMVAVLGCFNELRRDEWDDYELAEMAFQAERLNMGISGGWQDQYATVFGGFNFIEFRKDSNLIHPLRLKNRTILELQESLVLFEITSGRNSGSIHDDQKTTMQNMKVQSMVKKNVAHCFDMRESLLRGKLTDFGAGLNLAWELKRQFSNKISNDDLDDIYEYAMANGALGGKLLGAGGGGFFLFYVKTFAKNSFLSAMKNRGLSQTVFYFDHDGMQSWTNRITHKKVNKKVIKIENR